MFEKALLGYLCFFFVFSILVGIATGDMIASSNEDTINEVAQTDITKNPYEGTGANPFAWVTASARYISGWVRVLTWPVGVFFTGYASFFSIPFVLIGVVLLAGFIIRLFGR